MVVNFFTEGINVSGPINIEKNTSKKQLAIYLAFVHGVEPRAYCTVMSQLVSFSFSSCVRACVHVCVCVHVCTGKVGSF